ncbi:MAG: hypothetical protein JXR37_31820 [Kiritimatiellae bacterium]|nr:hypothetical protein [Kiritimatiellia bacterium]
MAYARVEPELRWLGCRGFWRTVAVLAVILLLGVAVRSVRVALRRADPVQASLYGQADLTPGLPAAFRVFVNDGRTGAALAGAKVNLALAGPKGRRVELGAARTGPDGIAAAETGLPDDLPAGEYTLEATAVSDAGKTTVSRAISVKRSYRILITTDKPLYQPGQTIHIRTLALATADLRPADGRDVVLEVLDPKGNKVFRKRLASSTFGIASADFVLADQVNEGDYTIAAMMGDTTSERGVAVKRYVLPKFRIDVTADRGFYTPGQTAVLDLEAGYTFGQPVAGADVRVTADEYVERFRTFAQVHGKTDENGRYHFEIPLKEFFVGQDLTKGDALVKLTAKVTDAAHHAQEKTINLTVTAAPLRIEAFPESGELVRNVENVVYVVTVYPDGRPAKTKVTLDGEPAPVATTELGIAKLTVTPREAALALTITAEDERGARATVTRTLQGGRRSDAFLLRTDRAVYRAGQTANVTVISAAPSARIFLDIVKDRRTWLMQTIQVENGTGELALDLPPDLVGTVELHAYRLLPDGNIVRDAKVIQVNRPEDLQLSATLEKATYRPGEKALLKLIVQARNGDPVQAALSLAGVDEAVFALSDLQPGLEQVYFALQDEILKPRYEIHAQVPLTPAQTLLTPEEPAPETQEASAVLFSAAQGSDGPARTEGERYSQKQAAVRQAQKQRVNELKRGALFSPFVLYLLFGVPVLLYAVLRLFVRRAVADAEPAELRALKRGMGSLLRRWVGAVYVPVLLAMGAGFLCASAVGGWEWLVLVLPGIGMAVMLGLLIAAARRVRRCQAAGATPLLRKMVGCVPVAYMLGVAAVVGLVVAEASGVTNDERGMLHRLLAVVVVAALMPGALSVAGRCAVRRVSVARWFVQFLGVPLLAALPVLALAVPAVLTPRLMRARGAMGGDIVEMEKGMLRQQDGAFDAMVFAAAMPAPGMAPAPDAVLAESASAGEAPALKAPTRIRRYFPETLFWLPQLMTDEKGRAQTEIELADSITTWRVTMSAVSALGRLGAGTTPIRVFQDFFVDIDFPVALTQNDEVSVPIAVFNYLDTEQTVRLEAQPEDWCAFLGERVRELKIGPRQVTSVYLPLRAVQPGTHTLTVKAFGTEMADAVERRVEVRPDGELVEQKINGSLSENLSQTLTIPGEAIDGASDLFVKIYPGSFSQVVEGLDGILRMPYGCFEQTSSSTYPNILVLDYMRRTKQIKPDIELKALNFINIGYQRLLSYEVPGGGFEWFGKAPAHNILTAYGLMEFGDMANVYEIDRKIIARTREWLLKGQAGDGTWRASDGGIAEGAINAFQGDNTLRTTAYITWALAETGEDGLEKGLDAVASGAGSENDPYTLALCANALCAGKRTGAARATLDRLAEMAVEEKDLAHWTSKAQGVTYTRGNCLDIETTALAACAMIRGNAHHALRKKALGWLVTQKDSAGTWHSTQATIHAMRALLAGTGPGGTVEGSLHVTIAANGKLVQELAITEEDSDVFRLISLREAVREGENRIALETSGKGDLAYQIVARHYLPWAQEPAAAEKAPLEIDVDYDTTTVPKDERLTCNVTVRYNREGVALMTIVDLGVPPGFEVETAGFEALKQREVIERYSVTGRQVILYFRQIRGGEPVTFAYRLKAKYPIRAKTPVSQAYQYYEPEVRAQAQPVVLTVEKGM